MALAINNENFETLVKGDKLVVIDFWATWCGPCKRLAPVIEALAQDYDGKAIIGKCDVEEDEALAMRFGIRSVPTIVFLKDGEEKDRIVGAAARPVFEEKINALI